MHEDSCEGTGGCGSRMLLELAEIDVPKLSLETGKPVWRLGNMLRSSGGPDCGRYITDTTMDIRPARLFHLRSPLASPLRPAPIYFMLILFLWDQTI
jgi:hypothetical protein